MSVFRSDNSAYITLKVAAFTCWVVAGLYMLAIFCMWKSLQISIAILECAADFVGSTVRIILVPFSFFIINIILFTAWGAGVLCVYSIGEITAEVDSSGT